MIDPLSRRHLVIAPDLLGPGASDRPYTVAASANGMRDLLGAPDVDRVTVVGDSRGGGVDGGDLSEGHREGVASHACQRPRQASGDVCRAASAIRRAVSVRRASREESIQPWTPA